MFSILIENKSVVAHCFPPCNAVIQMNMPLINIVLIWLANNFNVFKFLFNQKSVEDFFFFLLLFLNILYKI